MFQCKLCIQKGKDCSQILPGSYDPLSYLCQPPCEVQEDHDLPQLLNKLPLAFPRALDHLPLNLLCSSSFLPLSSSQVQGVHYYPSNYQSLISKPHVPSSSRQASLYSTKVLLFDVLPFLLCRFSQSSLLFFPSSFYSLCLQLPGQLQCQEVTTLSFFCHFSV